MLNNSAAEHGVDDVCTSHNNITTGVVSGSNTTDEEDYFRCRHLVPIRIQVRQMVVKKAIKFNVS
jgi:hypothetical protein